jgi:hypothetical protein
VIQEPASRTPRPVRLPGFVTGDEDIGLGDVIKRATAVLGLRPCDACAARAERLNGILVFAPRNAGRYPKPS